MSMAPSQLDPDTDFKMVAILPVNDPALTRSYGLSMFRVIDDPAVIQKNPDLAVYSSLPEALRSLSKGVRAPINCSRVFELRKVPHNSKRFFPYHLQRNQGTTTWDEKGLVKHEYLDTIVIVDKPIITSCVSPEAIPETLKTFGPLGVFSHEVHRTILQKIPELRVPSKSTMWGLPSLSLPKIRKDGKLAQSPRQAFEESKREWLRLRSCAIPLEDFRSLLSIFDMLPSLFRLNSRGYVYERSPNNRQQKTWCDLLMTRDCLLDDTHQNLCHLLATTEVLGPVHKGNKNTRGTRQCSGSINTLAFVPTTPMFRGDIRTPMIYLRKRCFRETAARLAVFHPHIPLLQAFPETPDNRTPDPLTHIKIRQRFVRTLYAIAFQLGLRSYPDPKDFPLSPSPERTRP